jgi:deoxyadenosine/deoxycytidine kinase
LNIYEKLYPSCEQVVAKPVLVIYLKDSPQNCLDRIHQRNRPYEQKIEPEFLSNLDIAYDSLFSDWTQCPLIKISKPDFDCMHQDDIDHLINQINAYTIAEAVKV